MMEQKLRFLEVLTPCLFTGEVWSLAPWFQRSTKLYRNVINCVCFLSSRHVSVCVFMLLRCIQIKRCACELIYDGYVYQNSCWYFFGSTSQLIIYIFLKEIKLQITKVKQTARVCFILFTSVFSVFVVFSYLRFISYSRVEEIRLSCKYSALLTNT